jgi:uncharacterized protein (DUF433 family)
MLHWSKCPAVERIPGKVSGAWLFVGTRVPVSALFENLEGGATVDEFLEWFPGVSRAQVEAVLEHAQRSLAEVPELGIMPAEEYVRLEKLRRAPLDALTGQFDELVATMQTTKSQKAVQALFGATPRPPLDSGGRD